MRYIVTILAALTLSAPAFGHPPGPNICHATNDPNWVAPPGCFHHPSHHGVVTK